VQGPMFVTDLLQGLANGFSFGQSAVAAIACAASVLLTLTLPVLAFAAITVASRASLSMSNLTIRSRCSGPTQRTPLPHGTAISGCPGIGWCATKVNEAGNRVLFRCLQPGERPSCLAVVLEHTPTRQRNPEVSRCVPDHTPHPGHTFPDALSRFGGTLPFYDRSGLIRQWAGLSWRRRVCSPQEEGPVR